MSFAWLDSGHVKGLIVFALVRMMLICLIVSG